MLEASTLPDLLREAARQSPDAEAFRYRDERLTYRDWDALADRLAAAFAARGVGHGDVVALLLPSTPFYLVAYLGAASLGAVTAGINVRYRRTEIGHILHRAAAPVLLAVERWHDADFAACSRRCAAICPSCARSSGSIRTAAAQHRGRRRPIAGGRPPDVDVAPTTRRRSSSPAARRACRRGRATRIGVSWRWRRSRPGATQRCAAVREAPRRRASRSPTSARWRASPSRSPTSARRSSTTLRPGDGARRRSSANA